MNIKTKKEKASSKKRIREIKQAIKSFENKREFARRIGDIEYVNECEIKIASLYEELERLEDE